MTEIPGTEKQIERMIMNKITVKAREDLRHLDFVKWVNLTKRFTAEIGKKNSLNGINAGEEDFDQQLFSQLWDEFYNENSKIFVANNVCISIWIDQRQNGFQKYYNV